MSHELSSSVERVGASPVDRAGVLAGVRVLWALALCVPVMLLAALAVRTLKHVALQQTLDDAFMFVRYADHLIAGHGVSWNVPGEPTYGLTAPAFLLVVTPIRWLLPDASCQAVVLASLLSGLLFMALLGVLVYRYGRGVVTEYGRVDDVDLEVRYLLCTMAVGLLFVARWHVGFHMATGMDTMLDTAAVAGLLLWHARVASGPSRGLVVGLGVASGLLFFVRPDLLVFAFGIPLTVAVLGPNAEARRSALATVGLAALSLGFALLLARQYFGVPLPLSFYAKQTGLYTGEIERVYVGSAMRNAHHIYSQYRPGLLLIGASALAHVGLRLRARRRLLPVAWGPRADSFGSLDIGILAAALVFFAYYTFVARMQIMGNKARFFTPVVPAVIFLAVRCLAVVWPLSAWVRAVKARVGAGALRLAGRFQLALWLLVVGLLGAGGFGLRHSFQGFLATQAETPRGVKWFDVEARLARSLYYWYRLDELSALPSDMVMATSEVGLPSALNPDRRIIDLVGLNDTQLIRDRLDPDKLLARERIDFIYMPHPHYSDYVASIRNSVRFQEDYEWHPGEQLGTDFGVAIRKASKYYRQLRAIVDKGPVAPRSEP